MALYKISTYSKYTVVLIGFMLCHTTSNLPPNCSNQAFFIRLLPSLVPSVQQKKARLSKCDNQETVSGLYAFLGHLSNSGNVSQKVENAFFL